MKRIDQILAELNRLERDSFVIKALGARTRGYLLNAGRAGTHLL